MKNVTNYIFTRAQNIKNTRIKAFRKSGIVKKIITLNFIHGGPLYFYMKGPFVMSVRSDRIQENVITIGSLVRSDLNKMGYGKVRKMEGEKVLVEYFYSVAKQKTVLLSLKSLKRVILYPQTRCYVRYQGQWLIGRIGEYDDRSYEVHFPDKKSFFIDEKFIYVRCAVPLEDPMEVLVQKGHETAFFHERRAQFMAAIIRQRASTCGMPGLISSRIELYPHQVEVARRVLEDPVQRYLLADEVGLGKTIEAGIILRQFLLDYPNRRVLILVPPFLLEQWDKELDEKFQLYDFPGVFLKSIDFINRLKDKKFAVDFLVIDEAHHVAAKAYSPDPLEREEYVTFCDLAHRTGNLLLLSATPVLNNERDFLSMLHLLDPDNYRLDDLELFKDKIKNRQEIGRLLLYLREGTKPFVMKRSVKRLRELFADDYFISQLADELEDALARPEIIQDDCDNIIRRIRLHITETYRLHRRMLRNRRGSLKKELLMGRYIEDGGISQLIREYELDERSEEVYSLIEAWREGAQAELACLSEDGAAPGRRAALQEVFFLLLQAAGSCPNELVKTVNCRLAGMATISNDEPGAGDKLPGLPLEKQLILCETAFFEGEEEILVEILNKLKVPPEEGDRIALLEIILEKYRGGRGKPAKKCVVFTSYPSVCEDIASRLNEFFGKEAVAVHSSLRNAEVVEDEMEKFKTEGKCFVMVSDASGEEGRNLQFAQVLIHFDLPWSPNRLEQRIGRLDRLGRQQPLRTHVLMGPETDKSLHEAWFELLDQGFNIFKSSIASLQFYVDDKLPQLKDLAFQEGASGLLGAIGQVREEIESEQLKLSEQNALDEIDVLEQGAAQYYEVLQALENDYYKLETEMDPWITEALKFVRKPGLGRLISYSTTNYTLVPADQLAGIAGEVTGTYCRSVATETNQGRLFRLGEPFVEDMARYIRWDDRGKAFAIWRCQSGWNPAEGAEWLGFRLVYIIEANMGPLLKQLRKKEMKGYDMRAVRRRADAFFPPIMKTIYMDTDGRVVSDRELLNILERPFKKKENMGSDYNLTKERISIIDQLIDRTVWPDICKQVREQSEKALIESADFQKTCMVLAERARKSMAERLEKLKLRLEREGSGLAVAKSLEAEAIIAKALVEGIRNPLILLDSVGFMVVSGRDPLKE